MDSIRSDIKNASRIKPEVLEERIQDAQERIEVESLSLKEERELQHHIKEWETQLKIAKVSSGLYERQKALDETMKAAREKMNSVKTELDEVFKQLGLQFEKKEKKAEEKEEREDPIKKLDQEWEE